MYVLYNIYVQDTGTKYNYEYASCSRFALRCRTIKNVHNLVSAPHYKALLQLLILT